MYPLISGIVLGGKQRLSTARALLLAFIYVQGMALTYTALGLVVAAAGCSSRRRCSTRMC
jgi:thiol:disulfide interchange protein DsbD